MTISNQYVFDVVLCGIRKQGAFSISDDDRCMYRDYNGHRCAAGMLISNHEYSPSMEGKIVAPAADNIVTQLLKHKGYDLGFVSSLQLAHDDAASSCSRNCDRFSRWEERMKWIAGSNHLRYTPPSQTERLAREMEALSSCVGSADTTTDSPRDLVYIPAIG